MQAARIRKGRKLDINDFRRRREELDLPTWFDLHEADLTIYRAIALVESGVVS
jgi:hypothetical protein